MIAKALKGRFNHHPIRSFAPNGAIIDMPLRGYVSPLGIIADSHK